MLASLLTTVVSSCHKRQVQVPAAPATLPAAKVTPPPPQPELVPPPAIAPATPQPGTESAIPNPPALPPPPPAKTPRRATRPVAPAQPAAPAPSPQGPVVPAPQLAIVLTPEQQRQYNNDIDQSIQRAEANLRSIGNRQLASEQQASFDEARNFIRQAQAARASDLPAAKRLAERADVLAANLANSFR